MATRTEHRISTEVGELAVCVTGEGPPAVFWHSLFVDGRAWDALLPLVSDLRTAIVITGPGHGRSTDPGKRYTLHDCATGAQQVLAELGVGQPVDWVGNAWGGHVGLAVDSANLRSLAAFGTPIPALAGRDRLRMRTLLTGYTLLGPIEPLVRAVSAATLAHGSVHSTYVGDCLRAADRRMLRNAIRSISLDRPDLTARVRQLEVPFLVAAGAHDEGFTPEQTVAITAEISGARAVTISDAARLAPLEQPRACAELLRQFWA